MPEHDGSEPGGLPAPIDSATPAQVIETGPLARLELVRPKILDEVVQRTMQEFPSSSLDLALGEALFSESFRLKRDRGNIFTKGRLKRDRKTISSLKKGLVKGPAESDRRVLLDMLARHYAEEIGGHFNAETYKFATHAIPLGFGWLLNAASLNKFLPWKMTAELHEALRITGEVEHLRKLSKMGTILLVPTHQSNIDSPIVGYLIYLMGLPPFAYGAGINLFSNPLLSYFMSNLGAYTVDRKKSSAIYKATLKNYSTVILREGMHSIFFPGGGRSRSGAIESHLKLGLLGTGLEAQIEGMKAGNPNSRVFVVPMTVSYHFVLEAASLIEDYLVEEGKHRLIMTDDESWQPTKILGFFWKFFAAKANVTCRVGRPLDMFGHFVDEEGNSIGPNGTSIDPRRLLTTRGELRVEPQRDKEYVHELGEKLVRRFHRENTVLTSHLLAFTLFETLRRKYPELDLYRFLRLSVPQRSITEADFLQAAARYHADARAAHDRGDLYLAPELLNASEPEDWIKDGSKQLGLYHDAAVFRRSEGEVWTEDMNLLYYYRNRLAGYGLSLLALQGGGRRATGQLDPKGFLA